MSTFLDKLYAAGFVKLRHDDPAALDGMTTFMWQGCVKVVLRQELIAYSKGYVGRYTSDGRDMTIYKVLVNTDKRRQGFGYGCLAQLLPIMHESGFDVYVEPVPFEKGSDISRETLIGLYQKLGFVPTDEHCKVMVKKISKEQERG